MAIGVPVIAQDEVVIYVGADDNNLYALNPDNGTVIWRDATFLGVTGLAGAGGIPGGGGETGANLPS